MKKILLLLVGLLLLAAIPLTIYLAGQRQELRKRAAPATTMQFIPATAAKKIGDIFTLEAQITTGENQVVAAEIHITYDPTKLEAQSITNGPLFPSVLTSGVVERGTASITVGAASAAQPVKGTGTVAVVRFKALDKTDTATPVKFATNTFVGGLGEGANNVLIGSTPANITITQTGSSASPTPTKATTPTPTIRSGATPTPTIKPNTTLTPTPTTGSGGTATTLTITSPAVDASLTDTLPTISGKAPAGATVTVTIYSSPQTCVATADSNGLWSCTPTSPLEAGPHNVVATAVTAGGATQTATTSFVVASDSQESGSQSAIPVSGDASTTFILITIGTLLFLSGLAIPAVIR